MSDTKAPSAWQLERAMSIAMQALEALEVTQGPGSVDENEAIAFITNQGADIPSLMQRLLLAAAEAKTNSDAVATRIADLRAREARFDRHQEAYRTAALSIMQTLPELFPAGKYKDALVAASVRVDQPGVVVTDETALPKEYVRVTRTPDKARIREDLLQGVVIDGAELRNPMPYITIRVG